MDKFNTRRVAEGLTAYAIERQNGWERHQEEGSATWAEQRRFWTDAILQGMARLDGGQPDPSLMERFDRELEQARGCYFFTPATRQMQKNTIRELRRFVSALEADGNDRRRQVNVVRELLEDMASHLPWTSADNGLDQARDQAEGALLRMTAQRPIRFTRILLGGELDPDGVEFLPGMVNDEESVRRTRGFQQLTVEYPEREEWPVLCIVCMGGGRRADAGTIDADDLDMAVIRAAGEAFMKRPEVRPVWSHQLAVPVHEQIRALKIEPGRAPEEITMPNTLKAFQAAVGGDIEAVGLDSDVCLICNELGKLTGLPANRRIGGDIIAGTFLIVGCADGEFCSLSDENAAYYDRELSKPIPSYGEPDQPTQWEFHVL